MNPSTIDYLSPVCGSEFPEDWYAFADGRHFWMQWRLAVALRLIDREGLDRQAPLTILDIGAGAGQLRDDLERTTRWTVDITDLNEAALRRARAGRGRTLYYDVCQRDRTRLGHYDAAFLFDVIEHVENPCALLRAAADHLRPGGTLFVNVPALQGLASAYDAAAGHLRRYSRASLAAEIRAAGCAPRNVEYWGLSMVPLLMLRKLAVGSHPTPETIRRGFEPPNRLADAVLRSLMRVELGLLRRPPLGTSVMAALHPLAA